MKNQAEMVKLFPSFKKMLNDRVGKSHRSSVEAEFLKWWVEVQYERRERVEYTDAKGDGKIDAVVHLPHGKIVVIQSKYNDGYSKIKPKVNTCPSKDWEEFETIAIPAFENDSKFNDYLKTKKIPTDKKLIYQKIFDASKDDSKVKFELITTFDRPPDLQNRLSLLDPINFQDINSIMALFQYQKNYQSPTAADLILTVDPTNRLTKSDKEFGILSTVVEIKIKEIIEYMQKHYPDYDIISKNVRTQLKSGKGSINENIRLTYEKKPKEFWYSHNGITILCEEIIKKEINSRNHKYTLRMPNIINGAQTVFTLREVEKNKINDEATVLVKIFEIEHNKKSDELVKHIIFRTNQQNPIQWYNLRANELTQYQLAKHFLKREVFYERRQNEARLNKSKIQGENLMIVGIQEMAQILEICKDGAKGVVKAVQEKKKLFENEHVFDELFAIEQERAFFQFVLYRLIQSLLKQLEKQDINYVIRTIFGIVHDTISDPKLVDRKTFQKWISIVNDDRHVLHYNSKPKSFKKLKKLCGNLYQLCENERKIIQNKRGRNTGADGLSIFIKEIETNEAVFNKSGKRTFGNKKQNLRSEIVKEFKNILKK
jgi:hypothetical protein